MEIQHLCSHCLLFLPYQKNEQEVEILLGVLRETSFLSSREMGSSPFSKTFALLIFHMFQTASLKTEEQTLLRAMAGRDLSMMNWSKLIQEEGQMVDQEGRTPMND